MCVNQDLIETCQLSDRRALRCYIYSALNPALGYIGVIGHRKPGFSGVWFASAYTKIHGNHCIRETTACVILTKCLPYCPRAL